MSFGPGHKEVSGFGCQVSGENADTRTLTPGTIILPDDLFAVEGFGQIKILAFGQIAAALS